MNRLICTILLASTCCVAQVNAANVADFLDFSLRAADSSLLMPGRMYVPPLANAGEARPLILFLHGGGEMGTNNTSQINGNIDNLLTKAKQRGAFLLAPQTNAGWHGQVPTDYASMLTEQAIEQHNVDPRRVYVTGLSMGGGGTWNMINRYGDMFAAAVPICAVLPSNDFSASSVLDEPIWAFHARNDTVVSVSSTRTVVNNLLTSAGEAVPTYPPTNNNTTWFEFQSQELDLRYLELPIGGHGIWNYVYAQERMYDWMFAHLEVPEPSSALLVALCSCLVGFRPRR